jgi:hypothetical protein
MSAIPSGVVRLKPTDPDQLKAASQLHSELLPQSIPARFGDYFMTHFYFTELVELDLITCDLFAHEGKYVGFIVYTQYPDSFMREGIRRRFIPLCLALARSIASNPGRIRAVFELFRKSGGIASKRSDRAGYWLTFGVLAPFRRLKIDERGTRISIALVNAMLDVFRAAGFARVDGAVGRTNKTAIFFYHACGFAIRDPGSGDDLEIQMDLERGDSVPESPKRGNS